MILSVAEKSGEGEQGMQLECDSSMKKHIHTAQEKEEHWEPQTDLLFYIFLFFFFLSSFTKDFMLTLLKISQLLVQLPSQSDQTFHST